MQSIIDFIAGIFRLFVFLALVLVGIAIWGYNSLRRLTEDVKEAWSNIQVSARKQLSMVKQLAEIARGYDESEKFTLLKISEDISLSSVQNIAQKSGTVLSAATATASRFPELKANQQYVQLMDSIQRCEGEQERARQTYNAAVKAYNTHRTSLPHLLYAGALGFRKADYLELTNIGVDAPMARESMNFDDSERLNQLLGSAASVTLEAGRKLSRQGMLLADTAIQRVQQSSPGEGRIPGSRSAAVDSSETELSKSPFSERA